MNRIYIIDGDVVPTNASSLKVKDTTLLKFENGKVTDTITDITEITNFLNS